MPITPRPEGKRHKGPPKFNKGDYVWHQNPGEQARRLGIVEHGPNSSLGWRYEVWLDECEVPQRTSEDELTLVEGDADPLALQQLKRKSERRAQALQAWREGKLPLRTAEDYEVRPFTDGKFGVWDRYYCCSATHKQFDTRADAQAWIEETKASQKPRGMEPIAR
jgi:hypothetical protein